MSHRFLTLILMLWACLGLPGAAAACSPARGAQIETNLELVARAPTILIGRVVRWDYEKAPEQQWFKKSSILVEPVAILKGEGPQASFRLADMLAMTEGLASPADSQPSAYDEFLEPHVNAFMGGCIRYNFVVGQLVVFFLQPKDGGWIPSESIFARWAEDVPSVDGPWVKLVRIYVQAAQLLKGQQRRFLRAERARLLAGQPRRIDRLMADDIERQIKRQRRPLF